MDSPLERRGLLGVGAATLALLAAKPAGTEAKKKRRKKKDRGNGGGNGFSRAESGEEKLFTVPDGGEEAESSPCPANTLAISGAYLLANPACQVVVSGPVDTDFSAWGVTISCPNGQQSQNNAVVAICIS